MSWRTAFTTGGFQVNGLESGKTHSVTVLTENASRRREEQRRPEHRPAQADNPLIGRAWTGSGQVGEGLRVQSSALRASPGPLTTDQRTMPSLSMTNVARVSKPSSSRKARRSAPRHRAARSRPAASE